MEEDVVLKSAFKVLKDEMMETIGNNRKDSDISKVLGLPDNTFEIFKQRIADRNFVKELVESEYKTDDVVLALKYTTTFAEFIYYILMIRIAKEKVAEVFDDLDSVLKLFTRLHK